MSKSLQFTPVMFLVVFALAQFFQPEKNEGERNPETGIFRIAEVNDTVKALISNSCFDCHSNGTNYPWYSRISPLSWFLTSHIKNGKEDLNFSNWDTYSDNDKLSHLVDIGEVLSEGEMPLKSYLFIHRDARLSEQEILLLINWTEKEGMRIMLGPSQ